MSAPPTNALCYGDCLDWMQRWDDATVDLIYLDPPFNSKHNYNVLYAPDGGGGGAQMRAFEDTWAWDAAAGARLAMYEGATARPAHKVIVGLAGILGPSGMLAYLTYMAERLEHMHRLLKPTGSLYYHCDPTASHYLKLVLDAVFGSASFRNEIIWRIGWVSGFKTKKRGWIRNHDTLLYYVRDPANIVFNKKYLSYPDGYVRRDGKAPTGKGIPIEDTWNCSRGDVLDSIMIKSFAKKTGYPTEKPVPLLERIISASSNAGDIVLDPFCGCGTTVDAARRLNRRWCGIDISAFAIDLIRDRRLHDRTIPTYGIPADLLGARKLSADKPFDFESWAVTRLPGFAPNMKQRGDGGVDGRATLALRPDDSSSRLALAQVKGGKFQATYLRDFQYVIDREKAAVGCFVTLDPAPRNHHASAKTAGLVHVSGAPYDRLNLWSIADYFDQRYPLLPNMTDPYSGKPIDQQTRLL